MHLNDETHYKLLKLLEQNPELSQRELAKELGISLGKANYCLQAVIERGWVKAKNFTHSSNKRAYAYILTPTGIEHKAKVTLRFLKHKVAEYDALQKYIEQLRQEVDDMETGLQPTPLINVDQTEQR